MGRTACTEPHCLTRVHFTFTFLFHIYVTFFMYMHNYHCHRVTTHLQLNILLLLLLLLLYLLTSLSAVRPFITDVYHGYLFFPIYRLLPPSPNLHLHVLQPSHSRSCWDVFAVNFGEVCALFVHENVNFRLL
jgi:hypothetical protein